MLHIICIEFGIDSRHFSGKNEFLKISKVYRLVEVSTFDDNFVGLCYIININYRIVKKRWLV